MAVMVVVVCGAARIRAQMKPTLPKSDVRAQAATRKTTEKSIMYLRTKKSTGNIFRVGIFLDIVWLATRTEGAHGACAWGARRNRIDPPWGWNWTVHVPVVAIDLRVRHRRVHVTLGNPVGRQEDNVPSHGKER